MLSRLGGRLSPLCACALPAVFGTGFSSHRQFTTALAALSSVFNPPLVGACGQLPGQQQSENTGSQQSENSSLHILYKLFKIRSDQNEICMAAASIRHQLPGLLAGMSPARERNEPMKKFLSCLLVLTLLLSAAPALALTNPVINPTFNKEEMLNIHGQKVKLEDINKTLGDLELGYFVVMPDYLMSEAPEHQFPFDWSPASTGIYYLPDAILEDSIRLNTVTEEDMKEGRISEEGFIDLMNRVTDAAVPLLSVLRVNPAKKYSDEIEQQHKEDFQHLEHFANNGDDQIFLAYNSDFESFELTDKEKARLQEVVAEGLQAIKGGLILFEPVDYFEHMGITEESVPLDGAAEAFASEDMNGKPFGAEDFAKYDLTLVNIWFTGCNPCIEEMPDLQALYEALPENVNLITICLDGEKEHALASAILEGAGTTFTTLKGDELEKGVLKNVQATPTTFFLDSQGNQVGAAVIGAMASMNNFVEGSLELINTRLSMLGQ